MDKKLIYDYIEERAAAFTDISDRIWEFAELSMEETKSAAAYVDFLQREGFEVCEQVVGIPTAFTASFGSESPRIGILAEYDALSSLSQKAGAMTKEPLVPGGSGHGCGHNLLGAGALGAAVAIKHMIEQGKLNGTVVLYGCPGEEGCAGKAFMARDGLFRDLDAALTWHPSDVNEVTTGSYAACLQIEYAFSGVAAHAAGCPDMGRSALDAAELMNVGVQFLREHIKRTDSIHYSFLDAGGPSPNVVQPTARVLYMVRSDCVSNAKKVLERVNNIARGAALMTDTQVSIRQIDGTSSTLSNEVLEKVLYENFLAAPMPDYTEEEWATANALAETYEKPGLPGSAVNHSPKIRRYVEEKTENGHRSINDFLIPQFHCDLMEMGSTDVGDVSWLTPTAQICTATWPSGTPGHSWQTVTVGKSSLAHKGMLLAAKVLAGAAADLMEQPDLLAQAKSEFLDAARNGYDCPLGPEVKPMPVV